jgi:tRNA modification GTPase
MHDLEETIVAVATPAGRGGVGCVRLSGPHAHPLAERLFRPAGSRTGGEIRFGRFIGRDGDPVDHGYLVRFEAARSFTGEPSAELWAHGSPPVLRELVDAALAAGARAAGPGEFTYRALRHGRLDLTRAEAVRDLVEARTLWQARTAFAQSEGSLARRLTPLREALLDLAARAEAAVEFVDEPETRRVSEDFGRALAAAAERAAALGRAMGTGRIARDGVQVAITGLPNVGKSSLFNALLSRERAIVSEIPGTTRDTLEDGVDLDGLPVRLVDTAGIRRSNDPIESEGVRRAKTALVESDLVLFVLDASRPVDAEERRALGELVPERAVIVANKADLPKSTGPFPEGALEVSARTGAGLEALRGALRERALDGGSLEDAVLSDARHGAAIAGCAEALGRGLRALAAGLSEEAVLEDIHEAMGRLGEITGEVGSDDLLDRVFATFCIGK